MDDKRFDKEKFESSVGGDNAYRTINVYGDIAGGVKKRKGWKKGLTITIVIVVAFIILASIFGEDNNRSLEEDGDFSFSHPYVGTLFLEGTISEDESGDGYNHVWMKNAIQSMTEDDNNKAILLYVNSPGGSVYATDEIYELLENYKEETGRPVYAYFGSMAASGGYYAAMAAEKIYANKNCWTGSIGVIVGTIFDISELMDKYGIKAIDITSGDNKAMGSNFHSMTDEQRAIFQSMVDETYSDFVHVVMKGRNMTEETVRALGDGRIYTASQAKAKGLLDTVCAMDTAKEEIKKNLQEDIEFEDIEYNPSLGFFRSLLGIAAEKKGASNEYEAILNLAKRCNTIELSYMSPVKK